MKKTSKQASRRIREQEAAKVVALAPSRTEPVRHLVNVAKVIDSMEAADYELSEQDEHEAVEGLIVAHGGYSDSLY